DRIRRRQGATLRDLLYGGCGGQDSQLPGRRRIHGVGRRPGTAGIFAGAIAFLIARSVSGVLGYKARIGAFLLLVFLVLATYYFHDFLTLSDPQARQEQMIQFTKNLGLIGAVLLIIANGTGPLTLDTSRNKGWRVETRA